MRLLGHGGGGGGGDNKRICNEWGTTSRATLLTTKWSTSHNAPAFTKGTKGNGNNEWQSCNDIKGAPNPVASIATVIYGSNETKHQTAVRTNGNEQRRPESKTELLQG